MDDDPKHEPSAGSGTGEIPPDVRGVALAALERLLPEGGPVVAAVSGGADSVALLRALHGAGRVSAVAHLDHALRPDSSADAGFVETLAAELGLPCVVERVDVAAVAARRGWNLEATGRRLRYALFARVARRHGAAAIATGHTLDDQVETVLLQLVRGAAWLRGMPERRDRVLRPLLGLRRAELRAWLRANDHGWRDDPSNRDPGPRRNWLRIELLPRLEARSPGVSLRLARLARLQEEAQTALADAAARLVDDDAGDGLPLDRLRRTPVAVVREGVAALLRAHGQSVAAERIGWAVDAIYAATETSGPARLRLSNDAELVIAYGRLAVRATSGYDPVAERTVRSPDELPDDIPRAALAAALAAGPLVVRGRRPGDWLRLPGGRKKLSDLLIDRKVPRDERDRLRLLARDDEVLWLEGFGLAAAPDVDPDVRFMRLALDEADAAAAAGEVPVGAVVVRRGEVIAAAGNRSEAAADPTAHAELLAVRAAAAARGSWRLDDATLYVTLEPCPMCFGAALQAHLGRIVYGAANRREGALGGVVDLRTSAWKRRPEVRGGVLAQAAAERLERFFALRRDGEPEAS